MRRKVNSSISDMVWNDKAARNAKKVASTCSEKPSDPSKRVIKKPFLTFCGENIHLSTTQDSWAETINDWNNSQEYFKPGFEGKSTIGDFNPVILELLATSEQLVR
ncbi:allurin-like [Rana temporaria]|uniref:allurin-like n=1 Tax=Rana temporaria TaxID=8407 RepID=UPI001AAE0472|nr:allurin-like [Rana temporaria]